MKKYEGAIPSVGLPVLYRLPRQYTCLFIATHLVKLYVEYVLINIDYIHSFVLHNKHASFRVYQTYRVISTVLNDILA
jgi:hypothetical protein